MSGGDEVILTLLPPELGWVGIAVGIYGIIDLLLKGPERRVLEREAHRKLTLGELIVWIGFWVALVAAGVGQLIDSTPLKLGGVAGGFLLSALGFKSVRSSSHPESAPSQRGRNPQSPC